MKRILVVIMLTACCVQGLSAEASLINKPEAPVKFFLESELGTVKVMYHTLQFGTGGTEFNYVTMGGQELLFPFERYNLGMVIADRHRLSFLYQPLEVNTNVRFKQDVIIDGKTFPADTPMALTYSFPFYRITYGYDFFEDDNLDLAAGLALQLRNASIIFRRLDGDEMTVNQNLGPVPAVHLFARYGFDFGLYMCADITGLWASSSIINGASFEFEGSILDASLRAGWEMMNKIDLFLNLRFLGGSAKGTSQYESLFWSQGTEKYTSNYLATMSLTFGLTVR